MVTDEVKAVLRQEMDRRGWHDDDCRAGLAAIIGGESGFLPRRETGWSHTANANIRRFFSVTRRLTDAELDALKASDVKFFNFVYGGRFGNRPGTDDGYNYRGGGLIQLTFRDNYATFAPLVGADLVGHPDLIVTPRVSAAVAVEYVKLRFHGGDFSALKATVGNSVGPPDAEKNRLYEEFRHTGEWDYDPVAVVPPAPEPPPGIDPIVDTFLESLHNLQRFFRDRKLYTGPIDDDPGPGTRAALQAYLRDRRT